MYVRFKILTVEPILGERAIKIEATHEIDSLSVTPANIRITKPGDTIEELLWDDFDIKGKTITLFLKEEPLINERYIVRIKGLKNIIEDELETNYSQSITFLSFTTSEISFISPIMHSTVSQLVIQINERVFETAKSGANYFEYEISSDPLFLSSILDKKESPDKKIVFDLEYEGQLYIRCRAHYVTQDVKHYSNWITSTCLYSKKDTSDNGAVEPMYQLDLDIIDTPANNAAEQNFAYIFDTEDLASIESVTVIAKPMDGRTAEVVLQSYEIIMGNMLIIAPQNPLPKNCLITVKIKNAKAGIRVLETYTHKFFSILEPCYGDIKDISNLLDIELDPEIVYYALVNASKLADYYTDIKLNGARKNMRYYEEVEYAKDFEKSMFVKYYAANQVLSQTRSGIAYRASLSGKLGEIEYSPKGALPDLTSTLKSLLTEADKWKLALQGHKDLPPDSKSAVKAAKCLPHNHARGGR